VHAVRAGIRIDRERHPREPKLRFESFRDAIETFIAARLGRSWDHVAQEIFEIYRALPKSS